MFCSKLATRVSTTQSPIVVQADLAVPSERWVSRIGAEVWLERAPLKYEGLSYTEIWISEAQERMVFAVPPAKLERMQEVCAKPRAWKPRSSANSSPPDNCD